MTRYRRGRRVAEPLVVVCGRGLAVRAVLVEDEGIVVWEPIWETWLMGYRPTWNLDRGRYTDTPKCRFVDGVWSRVESVL